MPDTKSRQSKDRLKMNAAWRFAVQFFTVCGFFLSYRVEIGGVVCYYIKCGNFIKQMKKRGFESLSIKRKEAAWYVLFCDRSTGGADPADRKSGRDTESGGRV
ncbi:MAG: hypothetical protein K6G66_10080 [Oscillospiraceae bacterium]|nr:hypothetical protein [Oscillospiraceae bacterium]